jgi:glycosyltransferase involved in cell wall biosynthesis
VRDRSGDQEGLPVVLMEAVGCGCPAVVGDVAGIDDLLGDAVPDVSVQPTDTSSLAAAVSAVLTNPEEALRRTAELREALVHTLDWDRVATGYGDVLEAAIS